MKAPTKSERGRISLLHYAAGGYATASEPVERVAPIGSVATEEERLQQEHNLSGKRAAQLETRFVWIFVQKPGENIGRLADDIPEIQYIHKQYAQHPEGQQLSDGVGKGME